MVLHSAMHLSTYCKTVSNFIGIVLLQKGISHEELIIPPELVIFTLPVPPRNKIHVSPVTGFSASVHAEVMRTCVVVRFLNIPFVSCQPILRSGILLLHGNILCKTCGFTLTKTFHQTIKSNSEHHPFAPPVTRGLPQGAVFLGWPINLILANNFNRLARRKLAPGVRCTLW